MNRINGLYEFCVCFGDSECTVIAKSYSSAKYKAFKKRCLDEIYNYYDFVKNNDNIHVKK